MRQRLAGVGLDAAVDLVGHQDDAAFVTQFGKGDEGVAGGHEAGRVVGEIDRDHARTRVEGAPTSRSRSSVQCEVRPASLPQG